MTAAVVACLLLVAPARSTPFHDRRTGPCAVTAMDCDGPGEPVEFAWRWESIEAPAIDDPAEAYMELFYRVWLRYADTSAPGHPRNPLSNGFGEDVVVTLGCHGEQVSAPAARLTYRVARLSRQPRHPALWSWWRPTERFLAETARGNARAYQRYLPHLLASMRGRKCDDARALRAAVLRELDAILAARAQTRFPRLFARGRRILGTPP